MTKEQLQQYQSMKKEQKQIELELERVRAAMLAPRTSQLTGMPRSGGYGDQMTAIVAQHLELQKMYEEKLAHLAAAQLEIERAIEMLEPTERMLMRYRYLDGLKWEEICVLMSYSWMHIHRLHAKALDMLKDKAPE